MAMSIEKSITTNFRLIKLYIIIYVLKKNLNIFQNNLL